MKTLLWFLLVGITCEVGIAQTVASHEILAIKNATVIDVKNGTLKPSLTVLVSGNRITTIGKRIKIPKNALVIDATGKFLIPGLWDMHAHALTDHRYTYSFPMFLANGVTGIREMGSNLSIEEVNKIRRDVSTRKLLGPRFGAVTYRLLDGVGAQARTAIEIPTEEEGRRIVRLYKQSGADFLKPYNLLSREVYLAIVDEAKKVKLPLEGHTPFSMSSAEVSDLGQLVIEHNFGVIVSTSSDEEKAREEFASKSMPWPQIEAKAAASYDPQKAKKLFDRFARNGTWSCPTVSFQMLLPLEGTNRAALANRYIPKSEIALWQTAYGRVQTALPPEYREVRVKVVREIVREMHDAGVGILAGTDTGAFFAVPGFSLHEELAELVRSGLSPLEALQSATLKPAIFLHKEKELGTVEKGKLADLVLLDANPLDDIKNTTMIAAVITNGRLIPKADLQKMLDTVERSKPLKP